MATWAKRLALVVLPVALLGAAAWSLHRELHGFHFRDLVAGIDALPRAALWLAGLATAANYLVLTGYDLLALRYAGRSLPRARVIFTSFIAFAFGNNVGLSVLSSGSVRLRLYSQWGLGAGEIARVIGFTSVQLWSGLLPLVGVALLAGSPGPLATAPARAVGVLALVLTAGYLALAARGREYTLRGVQFRLPSLPLATVQVLVSAADWAIAALVLYLLLPPGVPFDYVGVLGLFVVAQVAGLVSQVPGGVGVFESIVVASLGAAVPAPLVLSSLLAFRAVYYLAPFLLAFALLVVNEIVVRRQRVGRVLRGAHASFAPVVPWIAALATTLAGAVLLLSVATPSVSGRLHLLRRAVPLAILEASHLVASLVGTALLLLARGLSRRLDGAWTVSIGLLGAGVVASLLKGLDYEEALLLGAILIALLPFRREFYRRSSLLDLPLAGPWLVTVVAVIGASMWLGTFAYRHVEYSRELWFEFAYRAEAPRFLRASVVVVSFLALFGIATLLRPRPPEPGRPTEAELGRVRPLVDASSDTLAHLALTGDKALLFSEPGDAFLMFDVEGRSWVAMGDPVGPPRQATELAWRLRELADRHAGWACFYQVGTEALPRYLDMGLTVLRLGDEAIVPLQAFSLEGGERRGLRQSYARAQRDGLVFELLPPATVPAVLPALRRISDEWLAEKNVREKGFSLGFFDERYLREGPVALVRHRGALVAFANVWTGKPGTELSVDLMRHVRDAPRTTMDFLFVSLMLWGRERGYASFNLGMAPFSGLEDRSLAPLWNRAGARLFRHGEYFYNFQGLRQYKEKFAPEWRPRFLAAPGGLRLPVVLANVAALVSRGLKGVVAR